LMLATLYRHGPLTEKDLSGKTGFELNDIKSVVNILQQSGLALKIGHQFVVTTANWSEMQDKALSFLGRFHTENPYRLGMEREALRSRLKISKDILNHLVSTLSETSKVIENGTLLHLASHAIRFTVEEERAINSLLERLDREGVNSPGVKECKTIIGEPIYFALLESGKINQLNEEVVYSASTYESLMDRLIAYLEQREAVTAAEIRDLFGTSRKYAIALLEHLDEKQVTRRVGDSRVLVHSRLNAVK
jgi:selenocysteine-specific elongation factor